MIDVVAVKNAKFEKARVRSKKRLHPTADKPRVVVYKSNQYLYAQVIDDLSGKVVLSVSSRSKELKDQKLGKNVKSAEIIGKVLGQKLKEKKIEAICFDRNGFKYHGKVKALADACRSEGIKF